MDKCDNYKKHFTGAGVGWCLKHGRYCDKCGGEEIKPILDKEIEVVLSEDFIKRSTLGVSWKGTKEDEGKDEWHLLDTRFVVGMVKILMWGKKKYGEYNWQQVENAKTRYTNALMRHVTAYKEGELLDPVTKQSHLFHIAVNAYFLWWFTSRKRRKKNVT